VARTSPLINVMAGAARKAARGLIRDFGEVEQLQVSVKSPGDFVSTADLRAERTLKTELARARPGYGLLFEEGGETWRSHCQVSKQRRFGRQCTDVAPLRRRTQRPSMA